MVQKGGMGQGKFVPTHASKTGLGDHFRPQIPFSALSNHSSYLWWDIGRVKLLSIAWIGRNALNLGANSRGLEPNLSPPLTQKSGWDDGYTQWIPIWTLFLHSSYLWWDIGRVKGLWTNWISLSHLNHGSKRGYGSRQICPHSCLQNRFRWPFQTPNSILSLV